LAELEAKPAPVFGFDDSLFAQRTRAKKRASGKSAREDARAQHIFWGLMLCQIRGRAAPAATTATGLNSCRGRTTGATRPAFLLVAWLDNAGRRRRRRLFKTELT